MINPLIEETNLYVNVVRNNKFYFWSIILCAIMPIIITYNNILLEYKIILLIFCLGYYGWINSLIYFEMGYDYALNINKGEK